MFFECFFFEGVLLFVEDVFFDFGYKMLLDLFLFRL